MEFIKYEVTDLSATESDQTRGGNPVISVLASLIGIGVAVDQAADWFMEGWNNPK